VAAAVLVDLLVRARMEVTVRLLQAQGLAAAEVLVDQAAQTGPVDQERLAESVEAAPVERQAALAQP
jgi:hypothetical protein